MDKLEVYGGIRYFIATKNVPHQNSFNCKGTNIVSQQEELSGITLINQEIKVNVCVYSLNTLQCGEFRITFMICLSRGITNQEENQKNRSGGIFYKISGLGFSKFLKTKRRLHNCSSMNKIKETWHLNEMCDSELDPFLIKNIIGPTGKC